MSHWLPSKDTFVPVGNAPKPLAFDTKLTICGCEHRVIFGKKQVEEFNNDALVNENLSLTRGEANNGCDTVEFESTPAVDDVIASQARTPHATLQCREEWEVQSVVMHDVPDSDRRADADALPYMPVTSNIELPVEATTLGKEPLMTGTTR